MHYFAHPTAIIDDGATIGSDTKIWHFCHISSKARIGSNCTIGQNVYIADDVVIGDGVKIQNNVSIFTGVTVEDDVFIGPSVVFTNVLYPRSFIDQKNNFKKTWIKKGATIGANATIICGIELGEYCMIGAGTVLTKNAGSYELWYGNPASNHGTVAEDGNIISY
jgi:UDP-2-acetamido-3-amino-2,3-dideoxy-glucuronate N-acetyltransferase